jgi:Microcystin-dependent protein
MFIGTILPWPVNFAPYGWALCQGQSIPTAQNSALYSLIGNTYGGNSTNFNLPDLRGRFPIGQGVNPVNGQTCTIGNAANINNVTLTPYNVPVPQHIHQVTNTVNSTGSSTTVPVSLDIAIPVNTETSPSPANVNTPANNTLAVGKTSGALTSNIYTANGPTTGATLKPFTAAKDITIQVPTPTVTVTSICTNNSVTPATPFSIMPPYLCINYIIALEGIYPTRD